MEKAIYKLNFDCGRMGSLNGVFVAEKQYVNILVESKMEVYFGEVLGKHSEIYGPIEAGDIKMVSDSDEAIKVVEELDLSSGYNPFHYTTAGFSHEGIDQDEIENGLSVLEIVKKLAALKS